MKNFYGIIFCVLVSAAGYSQVNQVTFNYRNFNSLEAPRTNISPMSLRLMDNYNNGGPSAFGTVMEIYGFESHQTSQLHFGGWDNSRIRYREAFWAENSWSDWVTILDSKNNVESAGNLSITGTGNHKIAGNLSLGTLMPTTGAVLTVGGMVSCREIKVSVGAGADHVFKHDYKLMPLSVLEKYVAANKRLPEIASEDDMKSNGVSVSELQIKLLQKIEELTLHLIDQNKKITELENIIRRNKLK